MSHKTEDFKQQKKIIKYHQKRNPEVEITDVPMHKVKGGIGMARYTDEVYGHGKVGPIKKDSAGAKSAGHLGMAIGGTVGAVATEGLLASERINRNAPNAFFNPGTALPISATGTAAGAIAGRYAGRAIKNKNFRNAKPETITYQQAKQQYYTRERNGKIERVKMNAHARLQGMHPSVGSKLGR